MVEKFKPSLQKQIPFYPVIQLKHHEKNVIVSYEAPVSVNTKYKEAFPKLQFLGKLLTPGENCISRKCLIYKESAIFTKGISHQTGGSH
jgi:hypothetical protein